MAALQKFKLLATQCGVTQSPTRSPRTSPLLQIRRKKTSLRMLLTRSYGSGRRSPRRQEVSAIDHQQISILAPKKRDSLKDLFVSSPTYEAEENKEKVREMMSGKCEVYRMKSNGLGGELTTGTPRPGWMGFRHRCLIRRAWRPMLIGIPEEEDED